MARTIVHLSDLHFGRIDPEIPAELLRTVRALSPDLVVVSGDLTQRARICEFKAAAEFLRKLPHPLVTVPGNHDVPLDNLMLRVFSPLGRFRRLITTDMTPSYEDAEIAVIGLNTARALTLKDGRVNAAQILAVERRFAQCPRGVTRIVVTHHAFDVPEAGADASRSHNVVGRAPMAIAGFVRAGVDAILSGHLHAHGVDDTARRYPGPGGSLLLIRAGTATSTRRRGQTNAFNVLKIEPPEIVVECHGWDADARGFGPMNRARFGRTESGWSGEAAP